MGIVSAICVAGYVTTNKYIYGHFDITALQYSLVFAIAGAIFAASSLVHQMSKANSRLIKANAASLLIVGVAGALAVGIFTIGQHYTTAVNASLLMTSTIVATALFSHRLLNENHRRAQYAWMLILFIGLYIGVVGLRSIHLRTGDLVVIFSALFFGFGNAYSRVVMKRMGGARLVPNVRLTIGGLIALAVSPFVLRELSLPSRFVPYALLAGFFYWLCMKTFAKAVYLINANNTIVLNNAQIFFTSLGGVFILGESYSIEKLLGSLVAITAIYFIAVRK